MTLVDTQQLRLLNRALNNRPSTFFLILLYVAQITRSKSLMIYKSEIQWPNGYAEAKWEYRGTEKQSECISSCSGTRDAQPTDVEQLRTSQSTSIKVWIYVLLFNDMNSDDRRAWSTPGRTQPEVLILAVCTLCCCEWLVWIVSHFFPWLLLHQ